MAVYLGDSGFVEFSRTGAEKGIIVDVDPADVSTSARRLNFGFKNNQFMTGDRVQFVRLDSTGLTSTSNLDFAVAASFPGSAASPQAAWYVNVDEQNGMRLYNSSPEAIDGNASDALELAVPASQYKVRASIKNNLYSCFGQLQSYELNTDREVVDATVLGEYTRNQISSLISGSGSMTAFWDYKPTENTTGTDSQVDISNYYHQLILRQQQGSEFNGRFFVTRPPVDSTAKMVYYEAKCVVTGVAISFAPGDVLQSRIEFITTGRIELRVRKADALFNRLINQTSGAYNLQNSTGRLGLTNP
jgi:hypothetical protein